MILMTLVVTNGFPRSTPLSLIAFAQLALGIVVVSLSSVDSKLCDRCSVCYVYLVVYHTFDGS